MTDLSNQNRNRHNTKTLKYKEKTYLELIYCHRIWKK
jgi:hypothetical protein